MADERRLPDHPAGAGDSGGVGDAVEPPDPVASGDSAERGDGHDAAGSGGAGAASKAGDPAAEVPGAEKAGSGPDATAVGDEVGGDGTGTPSRPASEPAVATPMPHTGVDVDPERTMPLPGPDSTARIPAGTWSARAPVTPRYAPAVRPAATPEWEEPPAYGGRWWMPILVGTITLILLGTLVIGVWLIVQARSDRPASPIPTPSATATLSPSPSPTTTAPTTPTRTTTAAPTTTAPGQVVMPSLVGLPLGEARATLDGLGVDYQLSYRVSDAPAGTVIATDPGAGEVVTSEDTVTLMVATARPTPTSTAPPTSAGPATATATPSG